MERNFMDFDEAKRIFGEDSRWTSGNIVGGQIPAGEVRFGRVFAKTSVINDAEIKYPVIEVEGHGEMTGNQILASAAIPVSGDGKKADDYLIEQPLQGKPVYRINTKPVNPQFTGTPIGALINLQGRKARVKPVTVKVQTEFFRGEDRTKENMTQAVKSLGTKTAYEVTLIKETAKVD